MMSSTRTFSILALVSLALIGTLKGAEHKPLALHPDNPHYFLFQGKPTVLIGSGEHYGAVLNQDFDYVKYLNELQVHGLNHTRTFSGAYVEPEGAFRISKNTLAPAPGRFIAPWARSETPGYANGGNKFDLKRWNDAYFARLRDYVRHAGRRGIVVEMVLFCPYYEDKQWSLSPFNSTNNVNELSGVTRTNVFSLKGNTNVLSIHESMVRKIVTELRPFDNVYFEVCNEPYAAGVPDDWQAYVAERIEETEKRLENKHLISMNIANGSERIRRPHDAVSIYNFHYASPPDAIFLNSRLGKVIGDNETGFRGTDDLPYRIEAWNFIVNGGGLFSHLDYSFAVGHEDGSYNYPSTQPGGGNRAFREQMGFLKRFIHGVDFLRMKSNATFIRKGIPVGHTARALRLEDELFIVYISETPVPKDEFSVRWDAKIVPEYSETYTFHTESNDGVKLHVDNKPVIQNWTNHSMTEDQGTVELTAGRRHSVRLDYFQDGGNAVMRLFWSSPSQPKEIVPESRLYLPVGVKHGIRGKYYTGSRFNRLWTSRDDATIDFDWSSRSPFEDVFGEIGGESFAELVLSLNVDKYRAKWIDPKTGTVSKEQTVNFEPGETVLVSPAFSGDILLQIEKE